MEIAVQASAKYVPWGPEIPGGSRASQTDVWAPSSVFLVALSLWEDISVFTYPGQQQLTNTPLLSSRAFCLNRFKSFNPYKRLSVTHPYILVIPLTKTFDIPYAVRGHESRAVLLMTLLLQSDSNLRACSSSSSSESFVFTEWSGWPNLGVKLNCVDWDIIDDTLTMRPLSFAIG